MELNLLGCREYDEQTVDGRRRAGVTRSRMTKVKEIDRLR